MMPPEGYHLSSAMTYCGSGTWCREVFLAPDDPCKLFTDGVVPLTGGNWEDLGIDIQCEDDD